jgi:hypothetical protein
MKLFTIRYNLYILAFTHQRPQTFSYLFPVIPSSNLRFAHQWPFVRFGMCGSWHVFNDGPLQLLCVL